MRKDQEPPMPDDKSTISSSGGEKSVRETGRALSSGRTHRIGLLLTAIAVWVLVEAVRRWNRATSSGRRCWVCSMRSRGR